MRCHWWQEQVSNLCEIAISNNEDKKPPLMAAKTVKQGVEFDVLFWFNWWWEHLIFTFMLLMVSDDLILRVLVLVVLVMLGKDVGTTMQMA